MKVLCDFYKIKENLKPSTKYIIYTRVSKYYWYIENEKNIVNIGKNSRKNYICII